MDPLDNPEEYQNPLPNYKIPKKTDSNEAGSTEVQNYATPLNWGADNTTFDWSSYYGANTTDPNIVATASYPTVTYDLNAYQAAIAAYTQHKEVPKNVPKKRPFLESCPDISDPTLPKELTMQFQPLFCKLCQARLCSNSNALLHYKSKNHDKKVRNFLIQYAERTGEPLHKRAKKNTETTLFDDDPKNKHCDVCDLDFTSKLHADQHYMGRNHHKALLNKKPPGNCILGEDGKWHRIKKPESDPTGRNGIGLAFAKPEEFQQGKGKFFCTTCNIYCTSQESLDTHYKGQKHQKNVKKLGIQPQFGNVYNYTNFYVMNYYRENVYYNTCLLDQSTDPLVINNDDAWNPHADFVTPLEAPKIGEWEPISAPQPEKTNLSTCRTPSGNYYCQTCNVSLNSEKQFLQHLDSKKHIKNKQAITAIKSSAH